jgi:hypothetical protein
MQAFKNKTVVASILVIAVLAGAGFYYYRYAKVVPPLVLDRAEVPAEKEKEFIKDTSGITFHEKLLASLGCKYPPGEMRGAVSAGVLCTIEGQPLVKIGVYDEGIPKQLLSIDLARFGFTGVDPDPNSFSCFNVTQFQREDPPARFSYCTFKPMKGGAVLEYGLYVIDTDESKRTFILISQGSSFLEITKKFQEMLAGITFE